MPDWKPVNIAKCISRLISDKRIGGEWDSYILGDDPSKEKDVDPPQCKIGISQGKDIQDEYPLDVDKLAATIVNNRVTEPIGAIIYGSQDGVDYHPEQQGDRRYNRSALINMINAESFGSFLTSRLFWTTSVCLFSVVIFYTLSALGANNGWIGGMVAFLASVLFTLLWIVRRVIRVQMSAGIGGFFRHDLNIEVIQSLAVALPFIFRTLDSFVSDLKDYQSDCIAESDKFSKRPLDEKKREEQAEFYDNANATARTMVSWAISRRAAQYLSFQPVNTRDKFERNGVSRAKIAVAKLSYYTLLGGLIFILILLSLFAPVVLESFRPGASEAMLPYTVDARAYHIWPMANAIYISLFALLLSHGDISAYRSDRQRVTLALDDFWRRGKVRTAQQIGALHIPSRRLYDEKAENSGEHAIYPTAKEMIRLETKASSQDFSALATASLKNWKKSLFWKDLLIEIDPVPQLMQRYLKFLDTVGARSVVHNKKMTATPLCTQRISGIGSDARPRTRAIATLSRREIWHP